MLLLLLLFLKRFHAFLASLPFDLVLPDVTELAGELDSPPLPPLLAWPTEEETVEARPPVDVAE
jgi:hypothetical protein